VIGLDRAAKRPVRYGLPIYTKVWQGPGFWITPILRETAIDAKHQRAGAFSFRVPGLLGSRNKRALPRHSPAGKYTFNDEQRPDLSLQIL
jgi:hypothetical protein